MSHVTNYLTSTIATKKVIVRIVRHYEEQSDEVIQKRNVGTLDCFATLAMTEKDGLPRYARSDGVRML